uniref:Uncharacterized protein n=1 Tax=Trichuris muris TaxID=70415 RepID=A0A5S6Q7J7_TRIMR
MDCFRQLDLEDFLCVCFMTRRVQPAAFSILALNAELSRITQMSNTAALGRIEFLKERLCSLSSLWEATCKCLLVKLWAKRFENTISRKDGCSICFAAMKDYFTKTFLTVIHLILQVHGIQGIHTDHVANPIGKAMGFVNTLRSIGLYGDNGGHVIPKELLSRYELSADHFRLEHADGVSSVI